MGAFAPGVPVQPVLLDYSRNKCFNPGWGLDASTYWHFFRFQTQFRTYIDLTVLPVRCSQMSRTLWRVTLLRTVLTSNLGKFVLQLYHPSAEEKADARLFANNVRVLMAKHLQCSLSDFSTKVSPQPCFQEGLQRRLLMVPCSVELRPVVIMRLSAGGISAEDWRRACGLAVSEHRHGPQGWSAYFASSPQPTSGAGQAQGPVVTVQ